MSSPLKTAGMTKFSAMTAIAKKIGPLANLFGYNPRAPGGVYVSLPYCRLLFNRYELTP